MPLCKVARTVVDDSEENGDLLARAIKNNGEQWPLAVDRWMPQQSPSEGPYD
jgi:hypothetical protein